MLRLFLITLVFTCSCSLAQYIQQRVSANNVQAAQPDSMDQIPAWYHMAKPLASASSRANPSSVAAQASPSYYERIESGYEVPRRSGDQQMPTYERPGIQTNQYANYPPFQNRQPYENLNALTSGASLSNLQASRRYPSSSGTGSGSDTPYDSAIKRYHKLLIKRRPWTTKIPRILPSTSTSASSTITSTTSSTTTRKISKIRNNSTTVKSTTNETKKPKNKGPKSLQNIYSTIIPKQKQIQTTTTTIKYEGPIRRITPSSFIKTTLKPIESRKGWKMWKKITPKSVTNGIEVTSEPTLTTITQQPSTTTKINTTEEDLLIEKTTETIMTSSEEDQIKKITDEPVASTTTTTTTTTTTESTESTKSIDGKEENSENKENNKGKPTRYICRHMIGSNEHDPFSERRKSTIGPFRPIVVGTHKWKPLRFKKPEDGNATIESSETDNNSTTTQLTPLKPYPTGMNGLRLLEYLLKQTHIFSKGLQKALDGPNTELIAAIKDVVAKFKASLDEAGIDQDVRQMGNQLKNTWQQLRTGTNSRGPMNEQIGRLFEKAVSDAVDQKKLELNNQKNQ